MSDPRHPTYERVYAVVRQIPPGKVSTYGRIAAIVGNCTSRMVGYAMAALPADYDDVPWQRVINAQGKVSPRARSESTALQRKLLDDEGVHFNQAGKVDFSAVLWEGPSLDWLLANGFEPTASWREK